MATTLTEYFPYDAGNGANVTEASWRTFMGGINRNGVIKGYLNELACTGDSSGMQVKVATGGCWINGAYGGNTSGVQTLAIGASHATLNRYDLVVLRNDYTNNRIELDVIAGTPGASPTIPSVTVDTTKYEIALAYVYIAATVTTITAANVTDQRLWNNENNLIMRRTTLTSSGSSIVIDNIPARKHIFIRFSLIPSGSINSILRFNNDSGSNYSQNSSTNYGAGSLATSATSHNIQSAAAASYVRGEITIENISSQVKMSQIFSVDNGATNAASSAPNTFDNRGKWNNTSVPVSRIDILTTTNNFAAVSEATMWAWD